MTGPEVGAYRPYVAARAPEGRPSGKPAWRLLVHHKYQDDWESLADRVGLESAQQFYDHVTETPDQHPRIGTSGFLKGQKTPTGGWSKIIHFEISGAGRINYEYHPSYDGGAKGDKHQVVRILSINHSSH